MTHTSPRQSCVSTFSARRTTDVDAEVIEVGEYIPIPLGLSPVEYVFPLPEYIYLLESGVQGVLRGSLRGKLSGGEPGHVDLVRR